MVVWVRSSQIEDHAPLLKLLHGPGQITANVVKAIGVTFFQLLQCRIPGGLNHSTQVSQTQG